MSLHVPVKIARGRPDVLGLNPTREVTRPRKNRVVGIDRGPVSETTVLQRFPKCSIYCLARPLVRSVDPELKRSCALASLAEEKQKAKKQRERKERNEGTCSCSP